MKNLFLLTILCGSALFSHAQQLDIGVQGGYGNTRMLNSNVSDQGTRIDQVATFAPVFGIHAGYHFTPLLALKVEANYLMVDQKYKGDLFTVLPETYQANDKAGYVSVPVLVQLCSAHGFYVELGPQCSLLTGAQENYKVSSIFSGSSNSSETNVRSSFKRIVIGGAFGLGGNIRLTDFLYLNAGLRISYGLSDATKQYASEDDLDNANASGRKALADYYAHFDRYTTFGYKHTNEATGHVILGLSYRLNDGKKKPAGASHS